MAKIKATPEWFEKEWKPNPMACCKKNGMDCSVLPAGWENPAFWRDKTWSQCEEMLKKSKLSSWFDWSA